MLPELSVTPDPVNITVNTANIQDQIPVNVKVKNYVDGAKNAKVSLDLPEGWTSEPVVAEANFTERFEEQEVSFKLVPPATVAEGNFTIEATLPKRTESHSTRPYRKSNMSILMTLISCTPPAAINGVAFELLKPDNLKVGYIDSGFDTIADSLINAGFDITKLTPEDLASGDLSQYNTIVTGIRATLGREDLLANNDRLKEYVKNGGHLVMQYVTAADPWDGRSFNTTISFRNWFTINLSGE